MIAIRFYKLVFKKQVKLSHKKYGYFAEPKQNWYFTEMHKNPPPQTGAQ